MIFKQFIIYSLVNVKQSCKFPSNLWKPIKGELFAVYQMMFVYSGPHCSPPGPHTGQRVTIMEIFNDNCGGFSDDKKTEILFWLLKWLKCDLLVRCKMRQREDMSPQVSPGLPWLLIFSLVALPLPPTPPRVCILVGTTGETEMDKQMEITLKYFLVTPHLPPPRDVSYQLDSLSPRAQINSISWKNIKWRVSYQPEVTSLSEEIILTFQISNSLFTGFHSALTSSHLVRQLTWEEEGREGDGGDGGTC